MHSARLLAAASLAVLTAAATPHAGDAHAPAGGRVPGTLAADGPRRIALLVGIADYEHFEPGGPPGQSDLRGPPTDLARMRAALANYGFDDRAHVRLLSDAEASREGIAGGFAWLAAQVRDSSDVVVVYFSGHGTQVPDADGDEARLSDGDRFDEALVPWDARDIRDPADVVLDDQIGAWLDALPTRKLNIIIDACYSGTVTRDLGTAISRGPVGLGVPVDGEDDAARLSPVDSPYPVLTASGSHEVALEMSWPELGGRYSGVLTYHLTRLLDAAVGSGVSFEQLLPLLRSDMRDWSVQTAMLDGSREARALPVLFGGTDGPRRASFAVVAQGDAFLVRGGAASGLRPGTSLEVFRASDRSFAESIALLTIDSVAEATSFASLSVGERSDVASGSRAVISRMPPGLQAMSQLAVYVPPAASRVAAALRALPFVELTDSARAAVHLSPAGDGVHVAVDGERMSPFPTASGASRPSPWASGLVSTASGDAFAATPEALCVAMRRAFVARSLATVTNPVRAAGLDVSVRLVPTGTRPDTLSRSAVDTLYAGESYDVVVSARAPGVRPPRYISMALAGYSRAPALVFPASERAASRPVTIVNRGPAALVTLPVAAPYGGERLVVYFGSTPFSFSPLIDSAPVCESADDAGRRTRMAADDPAVSGWTSAERRFVILPKP